MIRKVYGGETTEKKKRKSRRRKIIYGKICYKTRARQSYYS